MVTTELLPHREIVVVVWCYQIRWIGLVEEFLDGSHRLQKSQCCPFSRTVPTCNFELLETEIPQKFLALNFLHNHSKSWTTNSCNKTCITHVLTTQSHKLINRPSFLRLNALICVCRLRLFMRLGLFVWLTHSRVGSVATSEPIALHGRIKDTWGLLRYRCSSEQNTSFVQHRWLFKIKYTGPTFCFLVANKQLE